MTTHQGPFQSYLKDIRQHLATGDATEHTHRPALQTLLDGLKTGILVTNEPKRIKCGAPDLSVARKTPHGPLTLGYLETKDVGEDLAAIEKDSSRANPATDNGRQLKRYRDALPNLILTNYLEFRWYVNGARRGDPVRLAVLDGAGKLKPDTAGQTAVLALLENFLAHTPGEISKPKELAERMARLTHLIRDVVVEAFGKNMASSTLQGLHAAFREVLVPDLSEQEFADMFSQTLAYGLFAARVQHQGPGPFQRHSAASLIPRTNPFLRRLFGDIAGPALDDEPFVGFVDDLAQLLHETDMAAVLADFGKRTKQEDPIVHFYETFLAAYDPKLRKTRGVYFTPEPVVSYIVRSVDHILRTRFNLPGGLADQATATYQTQDTQDKPVAHTGPRVLILDPACGTGTFLYAVLDLIRSEFMKQNNAGKWSGFVREQLLPRLFGFELLMAPYAVAHLKLGMQLAAKDLPEEQRHDWAYDFATGERLGVYLTNSLEEALKKSQLLMGQYISDEANAAADIKREKPVMVVLGNPPYSGHSANKGPWIKLLLEDYKKDYPDLNKPAQAKWLQDDYVKFIRFGQWRIQQTGQGVLAFITNHGYLDNPTFRGMRQKLMNAFTDIYILDLHGNTKKRERSPDGGQDENVFDIQQGVVIGLFVKEPGKNDPAMVRHAHLWSTREAKYEWLLGHDISDSSWKEIAPQEPFYLFTPQDAEVFAEYLRGFKLPDVMNQNGDPAPGIVTTHDEFAISWTAEESKEKVERFTNTASEEQARQIWRLCSQSQWNYDRAKQQLRNGTWTDKVVPILYRPFDVRWTVYDSNVAVHRRERVMRHMLAGQDVALVTVRQVAEGVFNHAFVANSVAESRITLSNKGIGFLFPLYLYPSEQEVASGLYPANERRPNLSPDFVKELEQRIGLTFIPDGSGDLQTTFGPEDVSFYIYGVFHSPTYRQRYAEFLKMDFPRVLLTSNVGLFRELAGKGAELVALHLMESPVLSQPITSYPVTGDNMVEAGHPRYIAPGEPEPGTGKPLAKGRVYISKDDAKTGKHGQYVQGVPKDVWEFHVGGYQVCDRWLKDRRGRMLTNADITHYEKIIVALNETIRLMAEIDQAIDAHGGWPLR